MIAIKTILKLVIRNMFEKKLRLILLVLSVAIPSALFFMANGAATNSRTLSREIKQKYVGSSDIVVEPNRRSPSTLRMELSAKYNAYFDYDIGTVETEGIYRPQPFEIMHVQLRGIELEDLAALYHVAYASEHNLQPFAGRKIIIGKQTADHYNLHPSDTIDLEINGSSERFVISGVAEAKGLFLDDGQAVFMAVPRGTLASITGNGYAVNSIFIKLKDPALKQQMMTWLSEEYKTYTVREAISAAELERDARERSDPYKLIVLVLLFMGVYVIYSSSRTMAMERLPVIGTLRSVGSTKWFTGSTLMGESLAVGVLGGVLGCVLGVGFLYLLMFITRPSSLRNLDLAVAFTWLQLAAAFSLSVVVSLASSLIPILQTVGLPIKHIIFGLVEPVPEKQKGRLILGLACILITLVAPRVISGNSALVVNLICAVMAVIAVVLLAPAVTAWFVRFMAHGYTYLFGNIGSLAARNLRENINVLNNTVLLTISIATFLVINTLTISITAEMKDLFRDNALFDVRVWVMNTDHNVNTLIARTPGVEGVFETPILKKVPIRGTDSAFETVHGAALNGFLSYWDVRAVDGTDTAAMMANLDSGRNILVSALMRDKLGLKVGDMITLGLRRGDVPYKVIGFIQTYNSGGRYAIIPERFFKIDVGGTYFSEFGVKTSGDSAEVSRNLKLQLVDRSPTIRTVDEQEQSNFEQFKAILIMLQAFSYVTLGVSLFGAINNFLINFAQRKRSLAMFRSIGMSKRQIVSMLLIESLSGGFIGGVLGVLGGLLLISVLPSFMIAIEQMAPIHLSAYATVASLVGGVLVSLLGSTGPALSSWRLNIIQAITYE